MVLNAPAKLNISLRIVGKSNGFHNLHSLVCFINLFDKVEVLPSNDEIVVESDLALGKKDLVYKAAYLLKKRYGYGGGAKIRIEKHIPVGAGLGGASSDAVTSLKALNRLWRLNLPKDDLVKIALMCGSDLPLFFENSELIFMSGRGEKIKPLKLSSAIYFVVVYPGVQISTKSAYCWYDQLTTGKIDTITHLPAVMDFDSLSKIAANDLQLPVSLKSEPVRNMLAALTDASCGSAVFMTGSGSSAVIMFKNKEEQEECFRNLKMESVWSCFKTHSIRLPVENKIF